MVRMKSLLAVSAVAALALLIAGCGGDSLTGPKPGPNAVPDFSLSDVNPASPSHNQNVSPRQYLGRVSGWYFGHAG